MKPKLTEYEKALFPVPFREWAKIFRWTYIATTIIALIWVSRLDLNCMPGASLGSSHPARKISDKLTPRGGPAGLETWVLPEYKLRDADTLAVYIENTLSEQHRVALGSPELSLNARMKYALGPFESRPPLRLLLGDDPPAQRLQGYAAWVDELGDRGDPAVREHVRGFLRFADNFSKTLHDPDNDHVATTYTPLFATAVWRETGNRVIMRLGKTTGADSVAPIFHPAAGKVVGTLSEARETRNRLLWLIPALLLALLYAFWNEYCRDRTGWKCTLVGIVGTGVWTLVAWEWFITKLDPITWMLLPIPFYAGIFLARKVRMIGAGRDPEAEFSKLYVKWYTPVLIAFAVLLVSGLFLSSTTGRLLLLVAGIMLGLIISHGWCIAEDFLAVKQYRAAPRDPKKNYAVLFLVFPVLGWFMQPYLPIRTNSPLQPVITSNSNDTAFAANPYWLGPLSDTETDTVIGALKKQVPDAEIYHPVICSPQPLTSEDRDWFRPAHSLPLLGRFEYTEEELEMERMNILGGWGLAVDRIDNLVKQNPTDTLLTLAWDAALHVGAVQRVTQELSNPHFDWSPPKSPTNFGFSLAPDNPRQEWRLLAMEQLERAANNLRTVSVEMLHRNPKTVGGDWFDAFHVGGGSTIAVVYTRDTTALQMFARNYAPKIQIAGPAVLRDAERESLRFAEIIGFILLSVLIAASIQKRWWTSICSLTGVAAGSGIAIFGGLPVAAVLLGSLCGLAFLLTLRDNKSGIGLGFVLLVMPVAAIAVSGLIVLSGGIIRILGNAD